MRQIMVAAVLLTLALGLQAVPRQSGGAQPRQLAAPAAAAPQPQRTIPCKTPENASVCYWTRGRLQRTTGSGAWKMWKVGTKREVTIFNGPSRFPPRDQDEVQNPEFPANLEKAYRAEVPRLQRLNQFMFDPAYADSEICPLEPEREGASQAVCIEAARIIFFDGSKRRYQ